MYIATTFVQQMIFAATNYLLGGLLLFLMSEYRLTKARSALILATAAVLGGVLHALLRQVMPLTMVAVVFVWLLASLPVILAQSLLTTDKSIRNIVLILIQANVVGYVVTSALHFTIQSDTPRFSIIVCGIVPIYLVLAVLYKLLARDAYLRMMKETDPSVRVWYLFTMVPGIFLAMQLLFVCMPDIRMNDYYFSLILCLAFCMMIVYVILFYTFSIFEQRARALKANESLNLQNALWTQQLQEFRKSVENTRRARHDMRHHDALLYAFLDSGDYEAAKAYLSKHMDTIERLHPTVYCDHNGINSMLVSFVEQALNADISPEIHAVAADDIGFDIVDLCGLISNLTENALNACKRYKGAKPMLNVSILEKKGRLQLDIANSCEDDVRLEDGHPVRRDDPDGGVGTRSVMSIVSKYNGVIEYTYSDCVFRVQAVLFATTV